MGLTGRDEESRSGAGRSHPHSRRQSRLGMPSAITGVFQGMLLLALLTADTFIHYRLRRS